MKTKLAAGEETDFRSTVFLRHKTDDPSRFPLTTYRSIGVYSSCRLPNE